MDKFLISQNNLTPSDIIQYFIIILLIFVYLKCNVSLLQLYTQLCRSLKLSRSLKLLAKFYYRSTFFLWFIFYRIETNEYFIYLTVDNSLLEFFFYMQNEILRHFLCFCFVAFAMVLCVLHIHITAFLM